MNDDFQEEIEIESSLIKFKRENFRTEIRKRINKEAMNTKRGFPSFISTNPNYQGIENPELQIHNNHLLQIRQSTDELKENQNLRIETLKIDETLQLFHSIFDNWSINQDDIGFNQITENMLSIFNYAQRYRLKFERFLIDENLMKPILKVINSDEFPLDAQVNLCAVLQNSFSQQNRDQKFLIQCINEYSVLHVLQQVIIKGVKNENLYCGILATIANLIGDSVQIRNFVLECNVLDLIVIQVAINKNPIAVHPNVIQIISFLLLHITNLGLQQIAFETLKLIFGVITIYLNVPDEFLMSETVFCLYSTVQNLILAENIQFNTMLSQQMDFFDRSIALLKSKFNTLKEEQLKIKNSHNFLFRKIILALALSFDNNDFPVQKFIIQNYWVIKLIQEILQTFESSKPIKEHIIKFFTNLILSSQRLKKEFVKCEIPQTITKLIKNSHPQTLIDIILFYYNLLYVYDQKIFDVYVLEQDSSILPDLLTDICSRTAENINYILILLEKILINGQRWEQDKKLDLNPVQRQIEEFNLSHVFEQLQNHENEKIYLYTFSLMEKYLKSD